MIIFINSLNVGGAERVVKKIVELVDYKFYLLLLFDENRIGLEIKYSYFLKSKPKNKLKYLFLPFIIIYKLIYFSFYLDKQLSLSFLTISNYLNIIFGKLTGSKTIIFVRTHISSEYPEGSLRSSLHRFLIKSLYPQADLIVVNSEGSKQDLKGILDTQVEIKVLYNPVELGISCNINSKPIKDKFTFVTCSRLIKSKNIELLIHGLNKINSDTKLVIIGDGPEKKSLVNISRNLKLEERIEFVGYKKNPHDLLKFCDCFLYASKYEGFPNVLLEALSCGLPIITSDCKAGPREILGFGTNYDISVTETVRCNVGYLYPVGDLKALILAMEKISTNNIDVKYFSSNINQTISKYSEEKFIKNFKKIIQCVA